MLSPKSLVVASNGIRPALSIQVGDKVWNGTEWAKVLQTKYTLKATHRVFRFADGGSAIVPDGAEVLQRTPAKYVWSKTMQGKKPYFCISHAPLPRAEAAIPPEVIPYYLNAVGYAAGTIVAGTEVRKPIWFVDPRAKGMPDEVLDVLYRRGCAVYVNDDGSIHIPIWDTELSFYECKLDRYGQPYRLTIKDAFGEGDLLYIQYTLRGIFDFSRRDRGYICIPKSLPGSERLGRMFRMFGVPYKSDSKYLYALEWAAAYAVGTWADTQNMPRINLQRTVSHLQVCEDLATQAAAHKPPSNFFGDWVLKMASNSLKASDPRRVSPAPYAIEMCHMALGTRPSVEIHEYMGADLQRVEEGPAVSITTNHGDSRIAADGILLR